MTTASKEMLEKYLTIMGMEDHSDLVKVTSKHAPLMVTSFENISEEEKDLFRIMAATRVDDIFNDAVDSLHRKTIVRATERGTLHTLPADFISNNPFANYCRLILVPGYESMAKNLPSIAGMLGEKSSSRELFQLFTHSHYYPEYFAYYAITTLFPSMAQLYTGDGNPLSSWFNKIVASILGVNATARVFQNTSTVSTLEVVFSTIMSAQVATSALQGSKDALTTAKSEEGFQFMMIPFSTLLAFTTLQQTMSASDALFAVPIAKQPLPDIVARTGEFLRDYYDWSKDPRGGKAGYDALLRDFRSKGYAV